MNGGQCYNNDKTNKVECLCPHPFNGKYCESSKIKWQWIVFNIEMNHFLDQLVLFLSTYTHTNQPMIIDTSGKLNLYYKSF